MRNNAIDVIASLIIWLYPFYIFGLCDCLAGYNNVDVAEFLLENGADVNAQDKGGLIPLHNASSYGVSSLGLEPVKLEHIWSI